MSYFKALSYLPYVIELLTLVPLIGKMPHADAASRLSNVLFRLADQVTGGKATRAVESAKVDQVAHGIVDLIVDIAD